jgi:hypothetical protein
MIDSFLASYGLKALKVGSPVLSIFEAAAESDLRNSQDIFALLRATTLGQATGTALDRLALDEGTQREVDTYASGGVNVTDTRFTKVVSTIFQGTSAPIAGVATINVVDGSTFPASGSIYIGRGTSDYEGPLAYSSITQVGVYWTIALSAGVTTQNFHNIGESVILAQGGNRQVPAGTIAQTPQGNASTSTQFKVLYTATLPDGETEVDGIQVIALLPGIGGNVQYNTITGWVNPPFTGAAVTNSLPFANAQAAETDDELRERIREIRATRAQGTPLAITTGVTGITSPDENKTVTSAAFVLPQGGLPAALYIDDGTGYEEIWTGVPFESVVAQANGGEQYFQIASDPPVTKANLTSLIVAPFSMTPGATLAILVGRVLSLHSFSASDFQNPLAASAFEVVASINRDAGIAFQARLSNSATTVTITARADTNETLQMASDELPKGAVDANLSLDFPVGLTETMRLYKNDRLLSKDGQVASVQSRPVSTWGLLNPVETLIVQVDGTASPAQVNLTVGTGDDVATNFATTALQLPIQANTLVVLVNGLPVGTDTGAGVIVGTTIAAGSTVDYASGVINVNFLTAPPLAATVTAFYVTVAAGPVPVYTFTAQSFINSNTGFTTVGINSLAAWATVINAAIPGITATAGGSTLTLTSNLGTSPRASVVISGGTLLGKLFNLVSSYGLSNDYTLNRNWGQISLVKSLQPYDVLSIGSFYTRAFIQSPPDPLTPTSAIPSITGAQGANWWFVLDGRAQVIPTGIAAGTQFTYSVSALENWGARVRLTSTTGASPFVSTLTGDDLVLWDPGLTANAQGRWRIDNVDPLGTWAEIGRQSLPMTGTGMTATLLNDGTVLICGGFRPIFGDFSAEACIYTPSTGAITVVGSLATGRGYHTASLIPTGANAGKVLVAGGLGATSLFQTINSAMLNPLASAEIYDPVAQTFSTAAAMPGPLAGHQAVTMDASGGVLADLILVAGGFDNSSPSTSICANAYYYNPTANTWTTAPSMRDARAYHQMLYVPASAPSGPYVLVTGGTTAIHSVFLSECEKLDLTSLTWSTTVPLNTGRYAHRTSLLADGTTVVTVGGFYSFSVLGAKLNGTLVTETFNGTAWTVVAPSQLTHVFGNAAPLGTSVAPQLIASSGADPSGTQGPNYSEIWDKTHDTWAYVANPEQPSRFDAAVVTLSPTRVLFAGGSTGTKGWDLLGVTTPLTTASAEVYTTAAIASINGVAVAAGSWYPVVDTTLGVQTLTNGGGVVVRTSSWVQQVTIPATSNVLIPVLAAAFTAQLEGGSAVVYQTQALRVNTNTYDLTGDIALVATDLQAQKFAIPTGDAIVNLPSHQPAVSTGGTDLGTPNFQTLSVTSALGPDEIQVTTGSDGQNGNEVISSGSTIVGLEGFYDENTPSGVLEVVPRFGSAYAFTSPILSQVPGVSNTNTVLTLRDDVPVEWLPQDRVYSAAPWTLTPFDTLTVVLDEDPENLRFIIPMYRRLTPASSTYAATNAFLDLDNSDQSLAVAFGTSTNTPPNGFNFADFAVFMHARAITDPSTIRAMLWRYYRLGEEGNLAQVRYDYGVGPNQPVTVTTDMYGQGIGGPSTALTTNISILLPTGPLITTGVSFTPSTRVGVAVLTGGPGDLYTLVYAFNLQAATAQRTSNVTTLTLTLPAGVTDSGLEVGNVVYLKSGNVNFPSGSYNITARGANTISYADIGANYGPVSNIGEVAYGPGDANLGGSIVAGTTIFNTTSTAFSPIQGEQLVFTGNGSQTASGAVTTIPGFIRPGSLAVFVGATQVGTDNGSGLITGSGIASGTVSDYSAGTLAFTLAAPAGVGIPVTVAWTALPTAFQDVTMGVHSYDGNGIIEGYANASPAGGGTGTTLEWFPAASIPAFQFYAVNTSANTVVQIAAAVNALAAVTNSIVPITAFALPGSTGSITQSSTDQELVADFYTPLTDGKNYVQTSTAPALVSGNYTFTFKDPINGALATGSDWQDEVVIIAPTNANTLVPWLNSQAVTGLSNNASLQVSGGGHRVVMASDTAGSQGAIQVQGGSANSISAPVQNFGQLIAEQTSPNPGAYMVCSVLTADATPGLTGDIYCALQNTNRMPRTLPIGPATTLSLYGIDAQGYVQLQTSTPQVAIERVEPDFICLQVEAQGEFVAYAWNGIGTMPSLTNVQEGDYVYVNTTAVPPTPSGFSNLPGADGGLFRVVRVDTLASVFWVQNPSAVATNGWAYMTFLQNDSLLPGDTITISTPVWGADNMGTWVVASVGVPNPLTTSNIVQPLFGMNRWFQLVNTNEQPINAFSPAAVTPLGTVNAQLIQVLEGNPSVLTKHLIAIAPNQEDGLYLDLKFDTAQGYTKVGIAAGTLVQPLDKLAFPTGVVNGIDAYAHSVGLIGEANKVVYGDTQDTATYPGIAAAGANINTSGPFIRRILISIVIRLNTSTATPNDIQEAVQSAVASYVNGLGTGVSVDLGAVVTAAESVFGIAGCAIQSPAYGPGNDIIAIQSFERARVLNLNDITVTFANQ